MSGGKQKTTSKQNQSLDPWARQNWQSQFGKIAGSPAGIDYDAYGRQNPDVAAEFGRQNRFDSRDAYYDYHINTRGRGEGRNIPMTEATGGLLSQPFEAYDRPLVAGLSDLEQRAIDMAGTGENYERTQGLLADVLGQARKDMTPRTFADFDADTYANPYADDIITQMTGDLTEAAERRRAQLESEKLAAGSYGGSRHGVQDALLTEDLLDTIADQSARIRFDTFDRGADRFYQDVGNEQASARDLAALGLQGVEMSDALYGRELDRLMGLGGTERGVEDRRLQADYAEEMRAYEDWWRRLQTEMQLLGSIPMFFDSEGTQTTQTNPGSLGILGAGLGAASMFGSGGMFGADGAFGGLFGGGT